MLAGVGVPTTAGVLAHGDRLGSCYRQTRKVLKQITAPLRISSDRILIYGLLLVLIGFLPWILVRQWFHDVAYVGDLGNFWSAGATVGTTALANVSEHFAWQTAHGLSKIAFLYLPGFAWIYWPLAQMPLMIALVVEEVAMVLLFAIAAALIARIYRFPLYFALVAVFAWGPALSAVLDGQNTGLGLMLSLAAILALLAQRDELAGLAIGLLLFKPTEALPLILLLALRRKWRALLAVLACAVGWYFSSVAATGGDWNWLSTYVKTVHEQYMIAMPLGYWKAYTLPSLVLAVGAPFGVAVASSVALLVLSIPPLLRTRLIEASSMIMVVGLAASVYAWPYEASILLPGLCFAMISITEPWRTRIVVVTYIVGSLGMVTPHAAHSLALICIGGALWWLGTQYAHRGTSQRVFAEGPSGEGLGLGN